jgi:hypothetical protein
MNFEIQLATAGRQLVGLAFKLTAQAALAIVSAARLLGTQCLLLCCVGFTVMPSLLKFWAPNLRLDGTASTLLKTA